MLGAELRELDAELLRELDAELRELGDVYPDERDELLLLLGLDEE